MKKFLVLFVLAFSLMSFSSSDVIVDDSVFLNDYEISLDNAYADGLTVYVCTVTVYYNGSPVKTFTSESYFESSACTDALREARAYIRMAESIDD